MDVSPAFMGLHNPMAAATPIPPRVALAFAIYNAISARTIVATATSDGSVSQKSPQLSAAEEKARDSALLTITLYISGENNYAEEPKDSDFKKAGLCEWMELPPHVRMQLLDAFPPNYNARQHALMQTRALMQQEQQAAIAAQIAAGMASPESQRSPASEPPKAKRTRRRTSAG
jgi:hypothetical protein